MRSVLVLLGAAFIFIFLAVPIGTQASAQSKTVTIALGRHDVPAGFTLRLARHHSNRQIAGSGLSLSVLKKKGRITDYETTFSNQPRHDAPTTIDDAVVAYTAQSGARWGYDFVVKAQATTKRVSLSTVGTASTVFVTEMKSAKSPTQVVYFMVFYRNNYAADITFSGPKSTTTTTLLLHMAKIIDGRIRKDG